LTAERIEELYALIGKIRKQSIPTSEIIVEQTLKELGLTKSTPINQAGKTPVDIIAHFNDYLYLAFGKSLEVLEKYESKVYPKILRELCVLRSKNLELIEEAEKGMSFPSKVASSLEMLYPDLWCVFLSRSNSRKQRGGKDFEQQIGQLLKLANIPFDKQIRKYHSDFMLPSAKAFERDRTRCILISAKRTLRERWQNVVNEIYETRCPNAFLCTSDEEINQSVIDRLREYNIHLVVWDKSKEEKFKNEPTVAGYTQLANLEIETFKRYWVR
jgi:hypothetical protein